MPAQQYATARRAAGPCIRTKIYAAGGAFNLTGEPDVLKGKPDIDAAMLGAGAIAIFRAREKTVVAAR
jgi:hypothetical protein